MKKETTKETYVSPTTDAVELHLEGVIAASSDPLGIEPPGFLDGGPLF